MVYAKSIIIQTKGFSDIKNITAEVQGVISKSGVMDGFVNVFVIGSTASITTIEFEPALIEDFKDEIEKLVPSNIKSRHSETWGDDNGFSHIRASLMGPGITVPVTGGRLVLGTWQQIVVIDHDNRSRPRDIYIQVMGE